MKNKLKITSRLLSWKITRSILFYYKRLHLVKAVLHLKWKSFFYGGFWYVVPVGSNGLKVVNDNYVKVFNKINPCNAITVQKLARMSLYSNNPSALNRPYAWNWTKKLKNILTFLKKNL